MEPTDNQHTVEHITGIWYMCTRCGYGLAIEQINDVCEYADRKLTARDKRQREIGFIVNLFYPAILARESMDVKEFVQLRETICARIDMIHKYGRTERWFASVNGWTRMVLSATNLKDLAWALMQGSVYVNHAAY